MSATPFDVEQTTVPAEGDQQHRENSSDTEQQPEHSSETETLLNQMDEVMEGTSTTISEKERQVAEKTIDSLCEKVAQLGGDAPDPPSSSSPPVVRQTYVILTDREAPEASFEYEGLRIHWMTINLPTVEQTKDTVIKLLEDPVPKNLIVWCFNKFILEQRTTNEVYEAFKIIRNKMWACKEHSLVAADCPFVPFYEKVWVFISTYNFFIRNINISMKRNPLSCHKAFLKRVKHLPKMCVKGDLWKEHKEGTGLGYEVSDDGWNKLRRWFGAHMLLGMDERVDHGTSLGKQECPTRLCQSPGYRSPVMVACLKGTGMYRFPDNRPRHERINYPRTWRIRNDPLRPSLVSIARRPSSASSGSSSSRRSGRSEYSRQSDDSLPTGASRYNEDEVLDKVKLVKLERDIADLTKELKISKEATEKEVKKRRNIEDKLHYRLERLSAELEWQARDRRNLDSKIAKLKDDLRYMKEDRDDYKKELDNRKKLADAIRRS